MDDRQRLLLAYGIAEYDTALAHLDALRRVGVAVPYIIIGRIQHERQNLIEHWRRSQGQTTWEPQQVTVDEARTYLTENVGPLDELLSEMGVKI